MKLVEVIRGLATSDATLDATLRLAESMENTSASERSRWFCVESGLDAFD